jgi:hypothetical protein
MGKEIATIQDSNGKAFTGTVVGSEPVSDAFDFFAGWFLAPMTLGATVPSNEYNTIVEVNGERHAGRRVG